MAVRLDATTSRVLPSGRTGAEVAGGFLDFKITGIEDLIQSLQRAADRCLKDPGGYLQKAIIEGMNEVRDTYRSKVNNITGNLRRATVTRPGKNKYEGVFIAVTGPRHAVSGKEWDVEEKGAGNHAFLVEFGTGPRRPSTQNRRNYLNVHQKINNRFRPATNREGGFVFDNEQFEKMGRGYYFLMGSINERHPARRTGRGAFVKTSGGGTRPYFIAPGETYPAMPAQHIMERSIGLTRNSVMSSVRSSLTRFIADLNNS
jgi:hypothetical protein